MTALTISQQTRTDPLLAKVARYCEVGWPSTIPDPGFAPYFTRRDELSVESGCVLWGYRIIVPPKLRQSLKSELHAGHVGASRMKELARSYMWWPGLDRELESLVRNCPQCLERRHMPTKAELHPWEWPSHPWHRLHLDFAGPVKNKYFLVLVDAHSKWVEIFPCSGPTAAETIRNLRKCFSQFGLPVSIVTDNGPCFVSSEFQEFVRNNGIRHSTTAVYKPSTNGLAERAIQSFKEAQVKTALPWETFLDNFLLKYRSTPHATTGVSPAELLFKRRLRTRLDLLFPGDQLGYRVSGKQEVQKFSRTASRSLNLNEGDPVMVRNYTPGAKWLPASVEKQTGPLSYRCALGDGRNIKRHQDQIISTDSQSSTSREDPVLETLSSATPAPTSVSEDLPVSSADVCPSEASRPSNSLISPSTESSPNVSRGIVSPSQLPLRCSTRVRRPVVKLDL